MVAPCSSFFSCHSLHALFDKGSSQTLQHRRGSRLIVRADAVSFKLLMHDAFPSNNDFLRFFYTNRAL